MAINADIRLTGFDKLVDGPSTLNPNSYLRVYYHNTRGDFITGITNGIVTSLASSSAKSIEAPSGPGAGLAGPTIMAEDYRNNGVIMTNNLAVATGDVNLDNWVVGNASSQNTTVFWTQPGNNNLFKVSERVSFSTDNYVANETLSITPFVFPGMSAFDQTPTGSRMVVAGVNEIAFIDAGDDPTVLASWQDIQASVVGNPVLTQCALNDAGTLAIMGGSNGDVAFWQIGNAPVRYTAAQNPFINANNQGAAPNVMTIVYSSFYGGFILLTDGQTHGFISETDFSSGIQSALIYSQDVLQLVAGQRGNPSGAASPEGDILIPGGNGAGYAMNMVIPT